MKFRDLVQSGKASSGVAWKLDTWLPPGKKEPVSGVTFNLCSGNSKDFFLGTSKLERLTEASEATIAAALVAADAGLDVEGLSPERIRHVLKHAAAAFAAFSKAVKS